MTDSAQDYTYEVLAVDSSGEAMIQLTSFDSLQHTMWYQLSPGDSDGTIADVVKDRASFAVMKWAEEREATPSITIGTPVSTRYKTLSESDKPLVNILTKLIESTESETADEIVTTYSVRDLTSEEKTEVYQNLSISREDIWLNLLEAGLIDSASSILGIDDPANDSDEIDFRHSHNIDFAAAASQKIKSTLGINDSDFAKFFVRD